MAEKYFIFLDATLESQARFFAETPVFQTWLHSYNNIADALQFISQIPLQNSIQIYMPRDNILDDGLPSDTNGQTRTIIETFCDLRTIRHVSVFSPNINTELEQQIPTIISDRRLIRDVISVTDLHPYMCREGIQWFNEEISRCISKNEAHLIPNLQRNIDELMEYLKKTIDDRKPLLEALVEERSNQLSQQPL